MTTRVRAASYAFLGRRRMPNSTRPTFVAKDGEQVIEMRSNESQAFPRKNERDFWCEAFRKLRFRICATEEEV